MSKQLHKTIDALTDALGKSDGQSTEEILADIKDEGIDADAILARLKKARLSIAKEGVKWKKGGKNGYRNKW